VTTQHATRADVITILNRLKQEGIITSCKAKLSTKPTTRPQIEVTVANEVAVAVALQQVRSALQPLGLALNIVARLGSSAGETP
jgi:hypothetical protein